MTESPDTPAEETLDPPTSDAAASSAVEPDASSDDAVIQARQLSKYYGPFIAAENVSFSIPKGQVAAFLGPNGAGKSTTMKMLTGLLSVSEGKARLFGKPVGRDGMAMTV